MSRVTLEIVPDPELSGGRLFPVAPQAQVLSALAQIDASVARLTQLVQARIISLDEARCQLGLSAPAKEGN